MTILNLTTEEKQNILMNGFNECMRNHLCGNYISVADIEGLETTDIEWEIDIKDKEFMGFKAITEFGDYSLEYDFDFSFDENLQTFYEGLVNFIYEFSFECPECHKRVDVKDTEYTYDVCGIPFRKLCRDCASDIMENRGYDGRDYRYDCSEEIW